ncbi:peptide chain release factor H [Aquimarina sp. 2201CG14-23]|uniref:peptide chain release factor H n=1 Tax=Aquimarina mycalae TaxID=3040073 RepID=UPI002478045A|nr:peptide chain release factor H [Aquimarina sp. 2201CG14-23]MDH7447741.1 peptide chain release factor H [Aquimarina sp. 2201CG14-23]
MKTKIIQITAGRGPAECCWVVAQVLKLFLEEIKSNGFTYNILQRDKGQENGTVQSVTIQLKGKEIEPFVKSWLGTIQWIGTSTFRKHHKRKNWFIGMYEIKQVQSISLNEKDISFQAMRSSGPGGQNVNKVNSAVRATYHPTGDQVVVMDSRSQHQNKKIAIERLKEKVYQSQLVKLKKSLCDQWENHLQVQRGNPIRTFKGTDFKKNYKKQSYASHRQQLKTALRNELKN